MLCNVFTTDGELRLCETWTRILIIFSTNTVNIHVSRRFLCNACLGLLDTRLATIFFFFLNLLNQYFIRVFRPKLKHIYLIWCDRILVWSKRKLYVTFHVYFRNINTVRLLCILLLLLSRQIVKWMCFRVGGG